MELRYEDVVHDPEFGLRRACECLGEDFDMRMLQYRKTAQDVVPAGSLMWLRNSVRPPDASKVFAWKSNLPESDRIIFEEIAGDTFEYFGYERESLTPTFMTKLRKMYLTVVNRL